jgi:hypothetical protein
MPMIVKHSFIVVLIAAVACATPSGGSSGASPDGGAATPARAHRGATAPITQDELQDPAIAADNVLDAIRALRPAFFNSRNASLDADNPGLNRKGEILASIDGAGLTQLSALRSIPVSQVMEIRYLSSTDAAQRFGTTSTGGPIILVTTRH